jgi:hypothetical protein
LLPFASFDSATDFTPADISLLGARPVADIAAASKRTSLNSAPHTEF